MIPRLTFCSALPCAARCFRAALYLCSRSRARFSDGALTPDYAWRYREGRRKRYAGQRLGGTVVVHFIKKNMWFLETAAALLHGEDVTAEERGLEQAHAPDSPRADEGSAARTLVRRRRGGGAQH